MKKLLIAASIIVLLAAAIVVLMRLLPDGNPPPVRVVTVEPSVLSTSVHTNGKVEPEQPFEIRAPLSGPCRILVREGDSVRQGDLLFVLDDAPLQSELLAARAELRAADAELRNIRRGPPPEELNQAEAECGRLQLVVDNARAQLQDNEWLFARNAVSRHELEQSRQALASAEQARQAARTKRDDLKARFTADDEKRAAARVEAAGARVRFVEGSLARTQVRAPAGGTVYSCVLKDGAHVSEGGQLAAMADLSRLRVRAFVDEPDLAHVRVDADVRVRWDGRPAELLSGKVRRISSQVSVLGGRSVAEVLCDVADSGRSLLPNANVDVEIETGESARLIAMARTVVFPEGKRSYVWTLRGDRARKQYVETGRSTPTQIEIKQGLSAGDRVIVPEDVAMVEGLRVRVQAQ